MNSVVYLTGVCHADELQYLFPVSDGLFPDQKPDDHDKNIAKILSTLWANFAKNGLVFKIYYTNTDM